MKDSQDWLDEILGYFALEQKRLKPNISTEQAKSAICKHILQDCLEILDSEKVPLGKIDGIGESFILMHNELLGELRNKFNDKYKED